MSSTADIGPGRVILVANVRELYNQKEVYYMHCVLNSVTNRACSFDSVDSQGE